MSGSANQPNTTQSQAINYINEHFSVHWLLGIGSVSFLAGIGLGIKKSGVTKEVSSMNPELAASGFKLATKALLYGTGICICTSYLVVRGSMAILDVKSVPEFAAKMKSLLSSEKTT